MNARLNQADRPQTSTRSIRRWIWLFAASAVCAAAGVQAAVDIDQSPLTVRSALPPNIMLIFDDSGSMNWSSMPDDPIPGVTESQDQLLSSDINGVYYNPEIDYLPPFTANGSSRYSAYPFNNAAINGFSPGTAGSSSRVNLATYTGGSDSAPNNNLKPQFSETFTISVPEEYGYANASCPSGTTADFSSTSHPGKCVSTTLTNPTCPTGYAITGLNTTNVRCAAQPIVPSCPTNFDFNSNSSSATAGLCIRTQNPSCPNGWSLQNANQSNVTCRRTLFGTLDASKLSCASDYTKRFSDVATLGKCVEDSNPSCSSPYQLTGSGAAKMCTVTPATTTAICATGTPDFAATAGKCRVTTYVDPNCPTNYDRFNTGTAGVSCRTVTAAGTTKYRSLFVYSVKSGSTYTRYYVAAANETTPSLPGSCNGAGDNGWPGCQVNYPGAGTCALVTGNPVTVNGVTYSGGLPADRCFGDDASRQNVANWYSYYHTRLLTAKSGLMNAFADLDPTIRYGFGSINGNTNDNGDNIPTPIYQPAGKPPFAQVEPFGNGSAGTRKEEFWEWLEDASAEDGTPLRRALDTVGKYYQTDHPWLTDVNDADGEQLSCRQSYTILNTDGLWNSDDGFWTATDGAKTSYGGNVDNATTVTTTTQTQRPGCDTNYSLNLTNSNNLGLCIRSGRSPRTPECPSNSWTLTNQNSADVMCERTVSNIGDSGTVTVTGPNGAEYVYTPAAPYADGHTDTLADVAMYYWLTDLRPDAETGLLNNVPTNDDDPAFWQHMTTFTVGLFGQDFSLPGISPSGTTADQIFNAAKSDTPIPGFAWPAPGSGSGSGTSANLSDLVHAGLNGHGGFYSAGNPELFVSSLRDALAKVQQRVGTGASLAANSTKLQTGTTTYQALYYSGTWRGDLKALGVDPNTGAIGETPLWSAASQLPAWDQRNIKTYNSGGSSAAEKFPIFDDPALLSSAARTALSTDPAEQVKLIDYLRGDATHEERNDGDYRNRSTTPLGDIVSSQPVYVGAPASTFYLGKNFTGASSYAAFANTNGGRSPRIWVAANDGLLHSFDADSGAEVFAYLPQAVIINGVKALSDPDYGSNAVPHEYYNDGEMTVADAYIGGDWKTVLVGTTGRGTTRAVYALDITDPDEPQLLWERSANDGASNSGYIGQIVGKPVIAQTSDGVWSVLVGNGYNSAQNKAALLQFELSAGTLNVHITDNQTNNGLAQPAVWIADPTTLVSTAAYAGDLKGRVWSFDLSVANSGGSALFTAADTAGKVQPITGGLLAGKDPDTGNVWVFFGTGRYLEQDDLTVSDAQSWYGIIVQAGPDKPATLVTNLSTGRSALVDRNIISETTPSATALGAREIEEGDTAEMEGESGWFMDLVVNDNERGERMVTPNQFQGNLLLGTTRIPGDGSDKCNPSGDGWIMAIDPFTGGRPGDEFFDLDGDGDVDDDDQINGTPAGGIGFTSIPNNPIFVGNVMLTSFDDASTRSILTSGSAGKPERLSWRELVGQ